MGKVDSRKKQMDNKQSKGNSTIDEKLYSRNESTESILQ
jgi:hypothetical protein